MAETRSLACFIVPLFAFLSLIDICQAATYGSGPYGRGAYGIGYETATTTIPTTGVRNMMLPSWIF